jgi:hypothetical protein
MIGSKAIAAISLLCALLLCAIGASSAFAATSGTTAFTCVESTTHEGDFEDAHCDKTVTPGTGKFTHKALPTNPTTATSTNAQTANGTKDSSPTVLKGILGGVITEIVCKTRNGHGTLENKLSGEKHSVVGSGTTVLTECTMPKPVNAEGQRTVQSQRTN